MERVRRGELESKGIPVRVGSICDSDLLHEIVRDRHTVFHLAAAQHETNVPKAHFYEINVEGTRKLLEACVAAGAPRFVLGSTIGVYGCANGHALDEESPTHPENVYTTTKLQAERVVHDFASKLPCTIVRISETYGPGDGRLLKFFKMVEGGIFPMIGRSRNAHQLVHVDDLVDGLLLAATREEAVGEAFVLTGPEVLTTRQMVQVAAAALGKSLHTPYVPLWPLLACATALENTLPLLGLSPPLSRRRLDFFTKSFVFRPGKAKNLLGYEPKKHFKEGVAETALWYREHGYL